MESMSWKISMGCVWCLRLTSERDTYIYFFPVIPIDYKLIASLANVDADHCGAVFSTDSSCTADGAVFCFPDDDCDDASDVLGLTCNASKHYSTMVEACATWIKPLKKRGNKDMYAKISIIWPCDIDNTQCAESKRKEVVRDLMACPKNPEFITSKIFCVMYSTKFVCSNFDKLTFFFFDTRKWTSKSAKAALTREILTGTYELITEVCASYMETIEPGAKILNFIQSFDNRKKVMYACAGMLYKEGFEELLDSRRDVMGTVGGVYDFAEGKFRKAEPEVKPIKRGLCQGSKEHQ